MLLGRQADPAISQRPTVEQSCESGSQPERDHGNTNKKRLQSEGSIDGEDPTIHKQNRHFDCGDHLEIQNRAYEGEFKIRRVRIRVERIRRPIVNCLLNLPLGIGVYADA